MLRRPRPITEGMLDFRRFYDNVHLACLHQFNPSTANGSERFLDSPVRYGPEGSAVDVIVIVHPRWCGDCLRARTKELTEGMKQRESKVNVTRETEVAARREKACINGVLSGRIPALSCLLEDSEHLGCTDLENGVWELVDSMLGLRLTSETFATDEELADIMQMYSLVTDELTYELELCFMEDREKSQGFLDGKSIQGRLERAAMDENDVETRKELLDRALL